MTTLWALTIAVLVAGMVLVSIFAKDTAPAVVPVVVGIVGAALAALQRPKPDTK